jgi:hypothetical protein
MIASRDSLFVFGTYRIVPIGTWVFSDVEVGAWAGAKASGKRAITFSVRPESQGVSEEVEAEGGDVSGVVSRIWTASLSYLRVQLGETSRAKGPTRRSRHPWRTPSIVSPILSE